ncbi:hypothetical protein [Actinoplanes sp. M2I2]|uniref:hypothetical protein n=1 Tax=Actinoplanes sp. M2I2 TaxID=1734444 RepID=UPI00201FB640|nr:hypothetical protein [Actinoplanes sp. M2I2]
MTEGGDPANGPDDSGGQDPRTLLILSVSTALGMLGVIADFRGALPEKLLTPFAFIWVIFGVSVGLFLVFRADRGQQWVTAVAVVALGASLLPPAYEFGTRFRAPAEATGTDRYVAIDSDLDGARVAGSVNLRGRSGELRPGERVWVLIQPSDSDFLYPQGWCDLSKTRWVCDGTKIGDETDSSELEFSAVAVIVDAAGSHTYGSYEEWIVECRVHLSRARCAGA